MVHVYSLFSILQILCVGLILLPPWIPHQLFQLTRVLLYLLRMMSLMLSLSDMMVSADGSPLKKHPRLFWGQVGVGKSGPQSCTTHSCRLWMGAPGLAKIPGWLQTRDPPASASWGFRGMFLYISLTKYTLSYKLCHVDCSKENRTWEAT